MIKMTNNSWCKLALVLKLLLLLLFLIEVSRHVHGRSRSSESCETSAVRQNVTLRGGIKAGYFHKLAQFVAMELCVQLCCQEKGCDVAFMIGNNCYGVKCFSEKLCGVVPTQNAPKALMISKVDFRGEVYLRKFMPEKLKCFKTSVEQNVTLSGGLLAGNFTAVGHAESIDACAKFCCVNDNCDLALLINDNCFMVICHNEDQCSSTPTTNTTFKTYIARVNRSKEITDEQETVLALSSIPGKSSKLMCKNGVVQYNQTLLGGYEAGKFKTLSQLTNMSSCIRMCCGEKSCDVALMIEKKCYGVTCHNLKQCRTIPAKNSVMLSHLNPRISFITSRNEEVTSIMLRRQSEACKANVISYDVTLRGGKHAGKYKTFGEVENMEECIRICCMEKHCDVAFMISGICFTVRCHSDNACEEVHATGTGFKPMLSYVVRERLVKHKENAQPKRHRKKHLHKKGHHKFTKNNTLHPDIPHIPSPSLPSLDNDHYCTNSEIMYNVTLKGGIGAGKYRDRGVLPNMQECLRICCIATTCDLAFMLGNHCLSVSCKNQTVCEVVAARSSAYRPRIAYIYARSREEDWASNPDKLPKQHGQLHVTRPILKKKYRSSPMRKNKSFKNKKNFHQRKSNKRRKKMKTSNTSVESRNRHETNVKENVLVKKSSLRKLKEKGLARNNYPTPQRTTDLIFPQTFSSVSTNVTSLVDFYKSNQNKTNSLNNTFSSSSEQPRSANLKKHFPVTEFSGKAFKAPGKKGTKYTSPQKDIFQPTLHTMNNLMAFMKGSNFKLLPKNKLFTLRKQAVSLQKMVSNIDLTLRRNPEKQFALVNKDKKKKHSSDTSEALKNNNNPNKQHNYSHRKMAQNVINSDVYGNQKVPNNLYGRNNIDRQRDHSAPVKEMVQHSHDSDKVPESRPTLKKEKSQKNKPDSFSKDLKNKRMKTKKNTDQTFNKRLPLSKISNNSKNYLSWKNIKDKYAFEKLNSTSTIFRTGVSSNNPDSLLQDAFTFQSDDGSVENPSKVRQPRILISTKTVNSRRISEPEKNKKLYIRSSNNRTAMFTAKAKTNRLKYSRRTSKMLSAKYQRHHKRQKLGNGSVVHST